MEIIRVGVDLAKNVFQLHGVDRHEKPAWTRSFRRGHWLHELQRRVAPGSEIGMEACAGAHHWGRQLRARGYRVKLMAPQFVKPYVKSNKERPQRRRGDLRSDEPAVDEVRGVKKR